MANYRDLSPVYLPLIVAIVYWRYARRKTLQSNDEAQQNEYSLPFANFPGANFPDDGAYSSPRLGDAPHR